MAELNQQTLAAFKNHRLIPVVSMPDADLAEPLADALVEAGLPCVEITFRTDAAEGSIQRLAKRGDIFVAAGTVLTEDQAKRAMDAGARCLLSPGTDPVVVEWCTTNRVDIIPGVATPTDILIAKRLGMNTLKFFPAETMGGPSALRAIAGPFPELRFIPTGGITRSNLTSYLALPNVLACGGSWLVNREVLSQRDFQPVRESAADAVELIRSLKNG
ncbi:MAG: bifunctional 4-hydroxy-2-oxoglutarate aldolase/2-dehydro-3-deoxy-phosphogluconate aldolase [Planctomycetota bacterium]